MKKVEYSQIVRRKLKDLKEYLTREFSPEVSAKSLKQITDAVRILEIFPEGYPLVSASYDVDCTYRYLYTGHQYLFYRIEEDRIIIVEMFDEKEDFMLKLFGVSEIETACRDEPDL